MTGGITSGTISIKSDVTPTAAFTWVPEADSGTLKSVMSGVIRKTSGRIAIVEITKRLRRNSRTSLRTTERMRVRLISTPRLDVVGDQLQIDVLERVVLLRQREDVRTGRDEGARDLGRHEP